MKKKSILSVLLALLMVFYTATPAMAATKPSTKTITFNSYATDDSDFTGFQSTLKVTNVTSVKTKDYSFYLSDEDVTISGKKSKVITCKAPATVSLQPNKGEKHARVVSFYGCCDSTKVDPSTVKVNYKYYAFDKSIYDFDFTKSYTEAPDSYGIAEGSSQKLTKAGTYVFYVRPLSAVDDTDVELTPVFVVVKK